MSPELIIGIVGLLGTVVGVPGILLWLLGRKDANKKLTLEGDALSLAKFNALLEAYEKRQERSDKDIADLQEISEKQNQAIKDLQDRDKEKQELLDKTNNRLERVRSLLMAYVRRVGIPMNEEETRIFEETLPLRPPIRARGYRPPSPPSNN